MKRTFRSLMALAIAVVTFAACSSDDAKYVADVSLPAGTEKTSDADILVEAGAHEFTFDIKTDGEWTVTSQNRFLHVQNAKGTGNATVTVRVENNRSDDRKVGRLVIAFPGHEELNKTITVEQKYLGDYGGNAADTIGTTNKIYAVGYGYDCTGEYASPNSVRGEIFRTSELIKSGTIGVNAVQLEMSDYTVTGSTVSEVSNKLTVKASVEGSYGAFKGEANASFDMETSEKTTYEYASTYFDVQKRRASFNTGVESLILNYMTDDAYNAINGLDVETSRGIAPTPYTADNEGFKKLIRDYGTHLIVEAGLGGRLRRSIEVNITEMTGAYDVKAFAKASYDGVCKAEASVDEEYKQSYKDNKKKIHKKTSVLGGTEELGTKLEDEENFTRDNFLQWKNSVTDKNMALVNFSDHSLIPLYDLVDRSLPGGQTRYEDLYDYMTKGDMAHDLSTYKCGTVTEFSVPSFDDAKWNSTLIKDIYLEGQWVGQVCNEYVPIINRNERITVIYPVVNNQPRYSMGFFLGDKSHKPARVSWNNSNTDVSVETYEDLDFGQATKLYLRGASVLAKLPEGTIAKEAGDARDEYLQGLRLDPTIDADKSSNYPLVKIFNKIWTRETYKHYVGTHVSKTYKVKMDGDDVDVTNVCYYPGEATNSSNWPAGWQVASWNDDYKPMLDKLAANNFGYPALELFNGHVTGFEFCFEGWNLRYGYTWYNDTQMNGTRDGISFWVKTDGTYTTESWNDNPNRIPVRLVKK